MVKYCNVATAVTGIVLYYCHDSELYDISSLFTSNWRNSDGDIMCNVIPI